MKVQHITIGGKKGVTHPKFGKLEDIAGEVNVAESFAEAVTLAGGEAKARDCLNYLTISGAKRNATARVLNAPEDDTPERLQSDLNKIFSEASPTPGRVGPTAATIKDFGSRAAEVLAGGDDPVAAMDRLRALAKELGIG